MTVRKIYRMLINRIMQSVNPIEWARKIGVNFPQGGIHLYGRISWSTEP